MDDKPFDESSVSSSNPIVELTNDYIRSPIKSVTPPLFQYHGIQPLNIQLPCEWMNHTIRVRKKYIGYLLNNLDKIHHRFGIKLIHSNNYFDEKSGHTIITYHVIPVGKEPFGGSDIEPADICQRIQQYIDSLTVNEAEDSSYDSDYDNDDGHEQVSRTTSDTLGQEYSEYISQPLIGQADHSPGYNQRLEFALKLGYTERLVQAALGRLGPNPAQNELLAELIKLGAQQGNKGEFSCDSPGTDCLSPGSDQTGTVPVGSGTGNDEITALRPIVIDGSNVAMSHGNKEVYSCRGIQLCVDWFRNRGHKEITVFVPKWRKENCRPDNPIKDQDILNELERERMLVFTPSRHVGGKRTVCYDDRYILKLAADNDGIVVSNDNYRDLLQENCEFKKVVEERVLMYSFVNDRFMPPDDPLGRSGPTLANFLRMQPKKGDTPLLCPYGKKCTYGNKCKFYHPERGSGPHKSVTERLSEHAARHLSAARNSDTQNKTVVQGKSLSVPLPSSGETSPISGSDRRKPLSRTRSGVPDCQYSTNAVLDQLPNYMSAQSGNWNPACHIIESQGGNFPKSHSIENISRDIYNATHPHPPAYGGQQMWAHRQQQSAQQPTTQQQSGSAIQTIENDDSSNLHRKLRRQLTLNPSCYDPRIYQMQQRCQQQQNQPLQHSSHRPLAPSLSGDPRNQHNAIQWDLHPNVTRIASAPDPSRPWSSGPPPASSSEPHINLWPQHNTQPTNQSQHLIEARRHLHFHLASIFPENQVQTVMQMYPDETNPQKICAAILSMFPRM